MYTSFSYLKLPGLNLCPQSLICQDFKAQPSNQNVFKIWFVFI